MSMPTTDKSPEVNAQVDARVSGAIDNPIINASPIVNIDSSGMPNPIVGGNPIINGPAEEEFSPDQEYVSAGCAAVVPPGARKIYMIMVVVTMLVGAGFVYALFKLFDL